MTRRPTIRTMLSVLMCALALGTTSVALAESPSDTNAQMSEQERLERADKRLDKRMAKMTDKLDLSADQATKIRAILEQTQAEIRDARERLEGKAARTEVRKLRKESRGKIKALLSDAQQAKAKGMLGKKHGKRMVKRLKRELNLSDAQSTQVKAIMKDTRKANRKLIEAAGGDRRAVRGKLKANRQAAQTKIKALLSDEQKTTYEALLAKRAERRAARRAERRGGSEL